MKLGMNDENNLKFSTRCQKLLCKDGIYTRGIQQNTSYQERIVRI